MKFNGNEQKKMHLRKKAHTHKYKMEMYSLCSTTVEKYTGVTAGHWQSISHKGNGLFTWKQARVCELKWEKANYSADSPRGIDRQKMWRRP